MYPALFLLPLAAAALAFFLLGRLARCRLGRPGGLPPGTLGLPLLGETLRLISAYKTEFPDPFVDDRLRRLRGGHRVFTTHLFGEPTVFSADPEVNRQVLQGEGRVFVSSYPSSITTLLGRRSLLVMRGAFHRRMHGLLGSTIASPVVIRDHLLPDIDRIIRRTLDAWEDADYPAGKRVLLQDQAKKEEHEAIRERKEGAVLDWNDYKSMPFTQCVINETLRVANIISGVFRRAVADVPIKGGYTIPKGCKVFASFRAVHMDPAYYADARSFDPWRWSPQQKTTTKGTLDHLNGGAGDDDDGDDKKSKKSLSNDNKQQLQVGVGGGNLFFCPFGGGPRLCPGYELGRVEISVFLHYLVTRFSWDAAEDDKVVFFPTTRTVKGYPINVRPRRRPSRTCAA